MQGCKRKLLVTIKGNVISIKNPVSRFIKTDSIGEIILDSETKCKIITK